ncbi:MAG: type VI secretion system baseplate subunit TssG [Gemmataceae bacterium]|nr:type VI secretion system baseplate subunit TssG [Gemmataceae bacterium]
MAPPNGREHPGLSADLLRAPYRFDFFQAVRLLERLAREAARADPRRPAAPVGEDEAPHREAVRFRALPSLSFPPAPVSKIDWPAADGARTNGTVPPAAMVVAFLGMIGPQGVLPPHYTALLLRRVRGKDFSLRDFLDLFHHRAVSLFYRAWEKYRLPFTYERARLDAAGGEEDLTAWCVYCLAGVGTGGLRGRLAIDDEAFLYYAGHFAHYPRSAAALEGILQDYFELPIQIQQAQGQWLVLDDVDQSSLPTPAHRNGRNCQMGVNAIVGERIWDVQGKFRVRVGPLTYDQFRRFMPDGDGLRALCQLARAYVGPEFDFDVHLILRRDAVPPCQVTTAAPELPRLGGNTWAGGRRRRRDVDDVVFSCDLAERGTAPADPPPG